MMRVMRAYSTETLAGLPVSEHYRPSKQAVMGHIRCRRKFVRMPNSVASSQLEARDLKVTLVAQQRQDTLPNSRARHSWRAKGLHKTPQASSSTSGDGGVSCTSIDEQQQGRPWRAKSPNPKLPTAGVMRWSKLADL